MHTKYYFSGISYLQISSLPCFNRPKLCTKRYVAVILKSLRDESFYGNLCS